MWLKPDKLVNFWSEATWLDYAATALIVAPYFVITSLIGRGDWLRSISVDQKLAIYEPAPPLHQLLAGSTR